MPRNSIALLEVGGALSRPQGLSPRILTVSNIIRTLGVCLGSDRALGAALYGLLDRPALLVSGHAVKLGRTMEFVFIDQQQVVSVQVKSLGLQGLVDCLLDFLQGAIAHEP